MKKLGIFALGIAIFTTFFGAGNIVFPLVLGREVGDKIPFALIGFVLTAVIVPMLGLISTALFEGNYEKFFAEAGKIPGYLLLFICLVVVGPFCVPRCIVLSYAAVQDYIPFCSLLMYSIFAALVVFAFTVKENKVVSILGRILGPVKILLLSSIIVFGLFTAYKLLTLPVSVSKSIFLGLKNGYYTCDLIGATFISYLIYSAIQNNETMSVKKLISKGVKASLIGALLLGSVYSGFSLIAAIHSPFLVGVPDARLLSVLAVKILGDKAGLLANITVAVACLTTAIALTTIVADYVTYKLFKGRVSYLYCLLAIIAIFIGMANLGFAGIMKWIDITVVLSYPTLIVLSIANICKKLFGFRFTKVVVAITFLSTLFFQYVL